MMKFFTRQHGELQPRRLKSAAEMEEAWQRILERRRLVDPGDSCGIDDWDMLSNMWIAWPMVWLARTSFFSFECEQQLDHFSDHSKEERTSQLTANDGFSLIA